MKKMLFICVFALIGSAMLLAQDINLPAPVKTGGKPLMQALSERKSIRSYQDKSLSDQTLSNLLWAANGFNRPDKRTAPTANNRQELELYVALESGIYLYEAQNNRLKLIRKGDFRKNTGVQDFVATAAANIIFVSDLGKASSEQYAFTDCGFVAQNIYLYCASEGLGSVVRGSFDKDELAKLLNLTGKMQVLLTQSVGYPK